MFAFVSIINVPISLELEYEIPETLIGEIGSGMVVVVPLSNRKAFGVVLELNDKKETDLKLEMVEKILHAGLSLAPEWLKIASELSDDLVQPVGRFLEKMLPRHFGFAIDKKFIIQADEIENLPEGLAELIERYNDTRLSSLQLSKKDRNQLDKLTNKSYILTEYDLVRKVNKLRKKKAYISLVSTMPDESDLVFGRSLDVRERRREALDYISREGPVQDQWIFASTGCSQSDLKWLLAHRLITSFVMEEPTEPIQSSDLTRNIELGSNVNNDELIFNLDEREIVLLKHSLGTDIMEVYFSLLMTCLDSNLNCWMIFPEIFEVELAAERFSALTGFVPYIYHSNLSTTKTAELWESIHKKNVRVIFGTTDALFLPIQQPGLIIIDEPQDCRSFKEHSFVYNAMAIADRIHQHFGTVNIYSSIQPPVKEWFESRYKIQRPSGMIIKYKEIGGNKPVAKLAIVNMAEELKAGNVSVISRHLQVEIRDSLKNRKLSLLFLNRKGYANFLFCRKCGFVQRCTNCGEILPVHSRINNRTKQEICRQCGNKNLIEDHCPSCGSSNYRPYGAGTEKVEDACKTLFPQARIARWESSIGSSKINEIIYARVMAGEVDILIGTQAVSKNIQLPKLGVLGFILAESNFYNIDPFQQEDAYRTFKGLISQTNQTSSIVLQTYHPNERLWEHLSNPNSTAFINQQLEYRSRFRYPPFGTVVKFSYKENEPELSIKAAKEMEKRIHLLMNEDNISDYQIITVPPNSGIIQKAYICHLIVRGLSVQQVRKLKDQYCWRIDVNPTSLI